MLLCKGDGTCFEQCYCVCYDPVTDEDYDECICGRGGKGACYLKTFECSCTLIECKNFDICKKALPKWAYDRLPGIGLCFDCWAYRGVMKKSDLAEECAICLDTKIVVSLECHHLHKLCLECWEKTIDSKPFPSCCPLCRKTIGAWKVNF